MAWRFEPKHNVCIPSFWRLGDKHTHVSWLTDCISPSAVPRRFSGGVVFYFSITGHFTMWESTPKPCQSSFYTNNLSLHVTKQGSTTPACIRPAEAAAASSLLYKKNVKNRPLNTSESECVSHHSLQTRWSTDFVTWFLKNVILMTIRCVGADKKTPKCAKQEDKGWQLTLCKCMAYCLFSQLNTVFIYKVLFTADDLFLLMLC